MSILDIMNKDTKQMKKEKHFPWLSQFESLMKWHVAQGHQKIVISKILLLSWLRSAYNVPGSVLKALNSQSIQPFRIVKIYRWDVKIL